MNRLNEMQFGKAIAESCAKINYSDIKGKPYAEVKERVTAFRRVSPCGVIQTEILADDGERCTVKANIYVYDPETGTLELIATGHASEVRTSSNVNRTSYIENCETSAVGRALGLAGFGIDAAIASADEVDQALIAQDQLKKRELEEQTLSPVEAAAFEAHLTSEGIDVDKMLAGLKIGSLEEMKLKVYRNIFDNMDKAREAWA